MWLPDSRHVMFVSGGRDFHVVDMQIAEGRESLLGPARHHRAAAVDARRTGSVLLASRHRRRHLAPDAVCVKPNAVTCLCQAWLKRARCVTRPFEKSGAPAATRTRDPRLRRVNSCVGSGLRFSRLRGLPRGCATRLICPASPRTRRIRPAHTSIGEHCATRQDVSAARSPYPRCGQTVAMDVRGRLTSYHGECTTGARAPW